MRPTGWTVVGDLSPFREDVRRYGPYRWRWQARLVAAWHVIRHDCGEAYVLPPGADLVRP